MSDSDQDPQRPQPELIEVGQGPFGERATSGNAGPPQRNLSPEMADELEFLLSLRQVTPRVIYSHLLFGLNVGVFAILVLVFGVPLMQPGAQDLLPFGANFTPYTRDGEWWRLFTCMFLHYGLIHIAFNMWVLRQVGPLVERMLGNTGFLVTYLASGLLGSLTSAWWNPGSVSAGASGAIFGIIGALVGTLLLGQGVIPRATLARLRKSLGTFLMLNIVLGMSVPSIGMAAHMGGLVGGLVCGVIMMRPDILLSSEGRGARNLLAAALCGLGMVWMLVALPEKGGEVTRVLLEFDLQQAQNAEELQAAVEDRQADRLDDESLASIVEALALNDRRSQEELDALRTGEFQLEDGLEAQLVVVSRKLTDRVEAFEILVRALRTGDELTVEQWFKSLNDSP